MHLSRRSLLLAALLQAASDVAALRLHVRGQSQSLGKRDHISGLDNGQNIKYYANITLGGSPFSVQIDTGSSDLWVAGTVPGANNTGFSSGVQYAIGAVQGPVQTAPLEFAGYTVSDQAFLDAPWPSVLITPSDDNPAGEGLIGLGPNVGSNVYDAMKKQPAGDAVLDRIFRQNTSTPNFITALLSRSDDPAEQFPGDVTVGEIVPGYENITSQAKVNVSTVPTKVAADQHWQVLLDPNGIIGPNGQSINFSTGVATTSNKKQLTAIFDTGFTLPQVPKSVSDAIYSGFEGAKYQNLSLTGPIWTLPCDIEVNITFKIGGQSYPVHPLDANLDLQVTDADGKKTCIGAFQPISTATDPDFDLILGMAFLRNAYLLVNFGDFVDGSTSRANPYVQLLSITNDTAAAHTDFVNVRLNGVDKTGDQRTTAGQTPDSNNNDDDDKSWFSRHKTAVIIAGAVGGGLVLLGIAAAIISSMRKRNRASSSGFISAGPSYRPLHEPAPAGEMQQVPGYQSGGAYPTPWDRR
ncbi:acid protease [Auriscalpium vulgare]|uniref:Acid protease n=1 Tax=Auriscalpium vulgare TaxID=40419 RepID=A0ACB8S4P5_9AGAM|nr:acid protease [Auriscalpium vulgare]